MDKMREEFEKWYKSQAVFHKAHLVPLPNGCYSGFVAETAWKAWQAAKSVPDAPDYSVTQLQRLKSLMSELGLSTDESLEGFCLDADRQLSRAITAMYKALSTFKSVPVVGEPVAYACPFHAGEAVVNGTPCMLVGERNVNDYAKERGFPLYSAPPDTEAELVRLRKDAERIEFMSSHARQVVKNWDWVGSTGFRQAIDVQIRLNERAADDQADAIDAAIAGEKK